MFKSERIVLFKPKRAENKKAQFDSDKHQNNLLKKKIHRLMKMKLILLLKKRRIREEEVR